jgi:hypothetical protein
MSWERRWNAITAVEVSRSEQRVEARLPEVVVASQRVDDAAVTHDREADTIGQRPIFVSACAIEVHATPKPVFRCGDNNHIRIRLKLL